MERARKEVSSRGMTAEKKKVRRKLNLFRLLLLLFSLLALVLVGAGTGLAIGIIKNLPRWDPGNLKMALSTTLYDKDNNVFAILHGGENRLPASLDEIPEHLQKAVIAIEDARFYQHYGIDLRSIARAAFNNLMYRQIREGGSTITQQLAKNAFIENPQRTFRRKIQEALLALQLERMYTKEEILEQYLNIVYFGPGAWSKSSCRGIFW